MAALGSTLTLEIIWLATDMRPLGLLSTFSHWLGMDFSRQILLLKKLNLFLHHVQPILYLDDGDDNNDDDLVQQLLDVGHDGPLV